MADMIFHLAFPIENIPDTKKFYVDGLGFEVSFEVTEDGKSGLLGVRRGAIALTLDSPMDGHGRDAINLEQLHGGEQHLQAIQDEIKAVYRNGVPLL